MGAARELDPRLAMSCPVVSPQHARAMSWAANPVSSLGEASQEPGALEYLLWAAVMASDRSQVALLAPLVACPSGWEVGCCTVVVVHLAADHAARAPLADGADRSQQELRNQADWALNRHGGVDVHNCDQHSRPLYSEGVEGEVALLDCRWLSVVVSHVHTDVGAPASRTAVVHRAEVVLCRNLAGGRSQFLGWMNHSYQEAASVLAFAYDYLGRAQHLDLGDHLSDTGRPKYS